MVSIIKVFKILNPVLGNFKLFQISLNNYLKKAHEDKCKTVVLLSQLNRKV
ncbi:unknown [Clostridium sp. CAG:306]|nr:unknown [Clostridium sp. CAG:306]